MPATLLLALFLVAHGAIHLSFLAPRPPVTADGPPWPFVLDRSWVLSPRGVRPELTRILGLALAAVTFAAFVLAAAEVLGLVPVSLWVPAIALGTGTSIALLALFFHPWLVLGVVIDAALLGAVFIAEWSPPSIG